MISKNSFWASLRENNRRRTWLWIVSWLFFLLYYIGGTALVISSRNNYVKSVLKIKSLTDMEMKQIILVSVSEFLRSPVILSMAVIVVAILAGIQGFSYLYQRKKVDLYHSLPVKKSKRFVVIWLNGMLVYAVPCLAGMIGGVLIAASQGVMNASVLGSVCMLYVMSLILYISFYNLVIIAVMLTGNMIITLFGIGVFSFYELIIRQLCVYYQQLFYEKYVISEEMKTYLLSPFYLYFSKVNWDYLQWSGILLPGLRILFLAILFLAIAYLCYWKRPAEAAGKAMAFSITKPVIKLAVVIPLVLAVALIIKHVTSGYERNAASGSPFFIGFSILLCAVLGCGIMEVIYEFDIKACIHHKKYILISSLAASVIFLCFRYDVTGYDDYIPDADMVESFALQLPMNNSYQYFDDKGNYMNAQSYIWSNMFVTDGEAICELAGYQPESADSNPSGTVKYRLKNGKTVYRTIWIDPDNAETDAILNRIVSSQEYKKGAYLIMADYYKERIIGNEKNKISYITGAYRYTISEEWALKLIDAYRKDIEFMGYDELYKTLPAGCLEFEVVENDPIRASYYSSYNQVEIFSGCVQTIACLKELGYYQKEYLIPEDIERIEVVNYNTVKEDEKSRQGTDVYDPYANMFYAEQVDYERQVWKTYSDRGEIQEISGIIYPGNMGTYMWPRSELIEDDYQVTVYFKRDSNPYKNSTISMNYLFPKGAVPMFIESATTYQE